MTLVNLFLGCPLVTDTLLPKNSFAFLIVLRTWLLPANMHVVRFLYMQVAQSSGWKPKNMTGQICGLHSFEVSILWTVTSSQRTIILSLGYPCGWLQDLGRTATFAHSWEMLLTPMFKDHKRIFGFGFKSLDRHSFGLRKKKKNRKRKE